MDKSWILIHLIPNFVTFTCHIPRFYWIHLNVQQNPRSARGFVNAFPKWGSPAGEEKQWEDGYTQAGHQNPEVNLGLPLEML